MYFAILAFSHRSAGTSPDGGEAKRGRAAGSGFWRAVFRSIGEKPMERRGKHGRVNHGMLVRFHAGVRCQNVEIVGQKVVLGCLKLTVNLMRNAFGHWRGSGIGGRRRSMSVGRGSIFVGNLNRLELSLREKRSSAASLSGHVFCCMYCWR